MKQLMILGAVLLSGLSLDAIAACTGVQVTGSSLTTLVSGQTVCATAGGERWQEEHKVGGQLWDYKLGPGDPVDPQEQVGNWSVDENNSTVTYTYGGGGSYTYTVWGTGPYSFCVGSSEVVSGANFQGGPSCP